MKASMASSSSAQSLSMAERMQAHLKWIDGKGGKSLEANLNSTSAPLDVIADFQKAHRLGSMFGRLEPALSFLQSLDGDKSGSLHGLHALVMENVRSVLKNKLGHASQEKLLELLELTFAFIRVPDLKMVPLMALSQLKEIPDKYIKALTNQKWRNILPELPTSVRQKAWVMNPPMFLDDVHALWIKGKQSPRAGVQPVCAMIGKNKALFDMLARECCERVVGRGDTKQDTSYRVLLHSTLVRAQENNEKLVAFTRLHDLTAILDGVLKVTKIRDADIGGIGRLLRALVQSQQAEDSDRVGRAAGIKQGNRQVARGREIKEAPSKSAFAVAPKLKAAKPAPKPKAAKPTKPAKHTRVSPISTELMMAMKEGWKFVSGLDREKIFKDPPDISVLPGYLDVVKQMRDLRTIASDIEFTYTTFDTMDSDIDLMLDNCLMYCAPGTTFHSSALDIKEKWFEKSNEIRERLGLQRRPASQPKKPLGMNTKSNPREKKSGDDEDQHQDQDEDLEDNGSNAEGAMDVDSDADDKAAVSTELPTGHAPALTSALVSSISMDPEVLEAPLLQCLEYLRDIDEQHIFRDPITDDIAPNYSNEIALPMDLSTISDKIGALVYSSFDQFDSDVCTMYTNCMQYNGYASDFGELADSMMKTWCEHAVEIERNITQGQGRRCTFPPQLHSLLNAAWSFMSNVDDEGWFKHPVINVPLYNDVVPKKDMRDLATIKHSLWRYHYLTVEQLAADIELMLTNAIKFNGAESPIGKLSQGYLVHWRTHKSSALQKQAEFNISEDWLFKHGGSVAASGVNALAASSVPLAPSDYTLDKALAEGWTFMSNLDHEGIFAQPVKALNYDAVIPRENARDLSTIASKRRRRDYLCLKGFGDDIRLMLSNCILFNGADSGYGKIAKQFLAAWNEHEKVLGALMAKGRDSALVHSPAIPPGPAPVPEFPPAAALRHARPVATTSAAVSERAPRPNQKRPRQASAATAVSKRSRPLASAAVGAPVTTHTQGPTDDIPTIPHPGLSLQCAMVLLTDSSFQGKLRVYLCDRMRATLKHGMLPFDDKLLCLSTLMLSFPEAIQHGSSRDASPPFPGIPQFLTRRFLPALALRIASSAHRSKTLSVEGLLQEMSLTEEKVGPIEWHAMLRMGAAVLGSLQQKG